MKPRVLMAIFFAVGAVLPVVALTAEVGNSACYECHKDAKEAYSQGSPHEPVVEGDCTACHQEHGAENKLKLTEEVPQLCYQCHDEATAAHKHEPVAEGSCLDCHTVHTAPGKGLLVKETPELCADCHDPVEGKGSTHQPVADGDCLNCHASHQSENAGLLTKTAPELCADCHDPTEGKGSTHQPVADGDCLDCHAAHQSDNTGLLTKSEPELCAECHSETDKSEGKNPHEPVQGGECSECHQAHQSDFQTLLTAKYAQNRYAVYDSNLYTLCYNCHDKEPFETPLSEGTNFRNGEKNLHYLHVFGPEEVSKYGIKKRKEGMTCMGCHLSHGTQQSKLVRVNLECGATFCYTMNYRRFEGGGSCVVGCHKPKVYRQNGAAGGETPPEEVSPLAQKPPEKEPPKAP